MVIIFRYPPLKHIRLHKLGYSIFRDPDVRERFKQDPYKVMDEFGLTEEEKQLVMSRDGVKMYDLGIQPYIIFALVWQAFGDWPSREKIKQLGYGRSIPQRTIER
ncbi:MAG TPA: hypothetical protein EYH45_04330 [Candidatus Caldiarchaeum subterraneum]|uniref:Extradiol ring-cleavage dioxygenase LigAB LigA subunit domain-containing protein n=1 Tax=Caldiarchaeum subterraneum TaxID=311458 RepID=A0A832ZW16_CALS0|nr:hypothetical protein [Aigarchaeota archaeon]HIQ29773.1 hypothetical protein [Candidatus Caldarchaeum subterraneum]